MKLNDIGTQQTVYIFACLLQENLITLLNDAIFCRSFCSAYSFCLSLYRASLSLSSCCHSASVALFLGIVSLGSLSRSFLRIRNLAGDKPVVEWGVVKTSHFKLVFWCWRFCNGFYPFFR